jgi:fibronectin type 3 domain-containing protein
LSMRVCYILLLLACWTVQAQVKSSLQVKGRVEKDKILIRIAPTTPNVWLKGVKHGYTIEKYLVVKEGQFIGNKQKTKHDLAVWPQKRWEALSATNDYALVAAQAMFGDSFELSNAQSNSVMEIYNKVQELESRFGFSLFCADISADVAKASALLFSDSLIQANERWFYKVYLNSPDPVKDTAFLYLNTNDAFPLPRVDNIEATFRDRVVHFSWSIKELSDSYTAYWIEQSEDSIHFKRTTKLPIVNLLNENQPSDKMEWVDSLQHNSRIYYFRIVGVSPFGIEGPPSKLVFGEGAKALSVVPSILAIYPEQTSAMIRWQIADEAQPLIKSFQVERSVSVDKNYVSISPLLKPADREFRDQKPSGTNYYRVRANGIDNKPLYSFPFLFQLLDSIPPVKPTGITAKADNKGIVSLQWTRNTEPDFLGYRVFRSNFSNSEFSLITKDPLAEPVFRDSIDLKNLSSNIYYKLTALDKRLNPSPYSVVIKIKKPDVVPPVSPSLTSVQQVDDRVVIRWEPSASLDVLKNKVFRKLDTESGWKAVGELPADSIRLNDPVPPGRRVSYYIASTDSTGNVSLPSQVFSIAITPVKASGVKKITASVDRAERAITLRWMAPSTPVVKYQVYRAEGEDPISLYKTIQGQLPVFVDKTLENDRVYKYRIKTVFENGEESKFSDEVRVEF